MPETCHECAKLVPSLNYAVYKGTHLRLCDDCLRRLGASRVAEPPEAAPAVTRPTLAPRVKARFEFTGLVAALGLSLVGILTVIGGVLLLVMPVAGVASFTLGLSAVIAGLVFLGFSAVIELLRIIAMRLDVLQQELGGRRPN